MKSPHPPNRPSRQQGIALVLVLCFVVLITGLIVAYFSRTLTTRQLSTASTSATNADLLADSATDTILGDLKQEIADTKVPASTIATPPPAAGTPTPAPVYIPTQAKYAVPQRNSPTAGGDPIPNLVRTSMRSDTLPPPGVGSRASAASSTTTSANGHIVSLPRWNRHYLIPTTASPGSTPSLTTSTPITNFVAPDWVFVTSDKGPTPITAPSSTVTGRYAYAIYDEGGLLDINHTGYPSASTLAHTGAKPAPSYADLTQLGMTAANVDSLLGWRNYATLQPTGTFPTLQAPSGSVTDKAYYNLFVSNPASILQVPLTVAANGMTDQMFLSRQQLVSYFATVGLDAKPLQYLSTFNRSLNQPSYAPEPNRPQVLQSVNGGNTTGDFSGNSSNNITPNFLTARVLHAFSNPNMPANPNTRYDGTPVVIGEPLVKKRFPLNRLAWLTYKGPSVNRSVNDPDVAQLIANGITADFLKQGTPDNIKTYFGLTWDPSSKWTYVHNNGSSILSISNPMNPTDVVRQTPGREPDFFELLKASINPGSIAKASLSPTVSNDPQALGAQYQRATDLSVDVAILQIGANIIDQFDTDSFPTQINYNVGVGMTPGTVYGDENLPYVSRVRAGLLRLKEANPAENLPSATTDSMTFKNTGIAALMYYPEVWNPHDWSSNPSDVTESLGVVGPQNFSVFAMTTPYGTTSTDYVYVDNGSSHSYAALQDDMKSPGFHSIYHFPFSNGSATVPGGGETRALTQKNTQITFVMNTASPTSGVFFREPTILFQPNVPANIQLTSPALKVTSGDQNNIGILNQDGSLFSNSPFGGLISDADGTTSPMAPYTKIPTAGSAYIGFYIGAHPLRWFPQGTTTGVPDANGNVTAAGSVVANQTHYGPVNDITFVLQCDDGLGGGGTINYDTKALSTQGEPNGILQSKPDTCFGLNGVTGPGGAQLDYGLRYFESIDPRSSRFGMLDSWIQQDTHPIAPKQYTAFGNYNTSGPYPAPDNSLFTRRQGADAGDALYDAFGDKPYLAGSEWFQTTMGWYHSSTEPKYWLYPGLLTQNSPVASTTATFYYADPDGVVRRASAGNVPAGTGPSNFPSPLVNTIGLPMAFARGTQASNYSSAYPPTLPARQMDSRPVILNRPFRSVAELGYVYSGTPWKNLDFFFPESGDVAMLDVFCVNDNSDSNGVTAGQVNLNTHQAPVLQAILAGSTKDLWNDTTSLAGTTAATIMGNSGAQAQQIAQLLVNRTTKGPASGLNKGQAQPLRNVSDLVGRWVNASSNGVSVGYNGQMSCDGFSADLSSYTSASGSADPVMYSTQRFAESAVRALSNAGQTRVWNLMFDIVAQTGRFTPQAINNGQLDQFNVEGEQHYWVHVAIDRYTGQVIDKQVEVVKE